jgi:hypothetical protein
VAVGGQHDVVGGQRVGGHEEAQVALDNAALVFVQAVRVRLQIEGAPHVHFLRHQVVGATVPDRSAERRNLAVPHPAEFSPESPWRS